MTREHAIELARRHNLRRVISDDLVIVWWPNGSKYTWVAHGWGRPKLPVVQS